MRRLKCSESALTTSKVWDVSHGWIRITYLGYALTSVQVLSLHSQKYYGFIQFSGAGAMSPSSLAASWPCAHVVSSVQSCSTP